MGLLPSHDIPNDSGPRVVDLEWRRCNTSLYACTVMYEIESRTWFNTNVNPEAIGILLQHLKKARNLVSP